MKRLWLFVVFAIVSCGNSESDTNKIVLYTASPVALLEPIKDAFTEDTGIEVEVIAAGTGELLKRIEAESRKPLGDVLWGGTLSAVSRNTDFFEEYVTVHDNKVYNDFKNVEGNLTRFTLIPSILMINENITSGVNVRGYADLLDPRLKGKIAFADPNLSSSAFEHLVNMLYAMGNGDPEKGWDFIEKLVVNLDGKILGSSSSVFKGVADSEYAVGLTHEGAALNYVAPGQPVKIVYMQEGVVVKPDGVYMIKGGPNEENAKLFMDYLVSDNVQSILEDMNYRTVRADIPSNGKIKPLSEIKLIKDDEVVVAAKKQEWLNKFKDILIK